ncbi:MAG: DUF599 family protein [Candidatus Micrarchaeota archaeon]
MADFTFASFDFGSMDSLAFVIFVLAVVFSIYSRTRAEKSKITTGKKIRELYRRSWVDNMLGSKDNGNLLEIVRNSILVSSALITAIVISFGFVVANAVIDGFSLISTLRLTAIVSLLLYSLFAIFLEARTLIYIPIVAGASEEVIKQNEKRSKSHYVSMLLDSAFDEFANSMRALFYVVVLLVWFFNTYLFIAATLLITYIMFREDFGTKSRIGVF